MYNVINMKLILL